MDRGLVERIRKAVRNPVLTRNVLKATNTSLRHRDDVVAEREDWEELRDRAAAVKDHCLARLDEVLADFVGNARSRGATVHFAKDGEEACRIILELARRNGCSRILKAKSMATEEVGLNRAFERRGFTPQETDLGEFIVQLGHEPPSHITAPALHRSTEEIRDLFAKEGIIAKLGEAPSDRKQLARWLSLAAREHLRGRLLDSDLGISGANFLVAETGSAALVENEGNIRFSTTTPRIHVVLAGIDKLIPRFTDLGTFLPLLTRSATGQRATAYVSLISGPIEELHFVLLDNGRIARLADPADRQVFRCIRCGACMNTCPVYRTVGGHAYGSPYPGPIGVLLTPMLRGRRGDQDLPQASSLCGACSEICPVKIDIHGHLLRLRHRAAISDPGRIPERIAMRIFRYLVSKPWRYRFAAALARRFSGLAVRLGLAAAWTKRREAPRFAPRSFHAIYREEAAKEPRRGA